MNDKTIYANATLQIPTLQPTFYGLVFMAGLVVGGILGAYYVTKYYGVQ